MTALPPPVESHSASAILVTWTRLFDLRSHTIVPPCSLSHTLRLDVLMLKTATKYLPSSFRSYRTMSTYTTVKTPFGVSHEVPTGIFMSVLTSTCLLCRLTASNNQWSTSSDGKTFDTKNPVNDQTLLSFAHGTQEDVDRAVKAARKAFQTTWGNTIHATERATCASIPEFQAIRTHW